MGSQKFGTYWTGDNNSINSEVQGSVNMILQLAISGHSFGGADVPGFYGNVTDNLFVKFYQLGAWYPFFRAHSHIDTPHREPWLQSERVQIAIRDSINQRYDFIHYLYTTFEIYTRTAEPIWRPLWMEFPDSPEVYNIYQEFMIGDSILFAPKSESSQFNWFNFCHIDYYLPSGTWFNYQSKQIEPNTQ